MMNRKALIIGNPGERNEDNYCDGVLVDMRRYRRFFSSSLGGAWGDEEITVVEKPSLEELAKELVELASCEYSMIVFSGHGYFSKKWETTILELNKEDEISLTLLKKGSLKQTIVLDCCRKVEPRYLIEDEVKLAKSMPHLDPDECRIYYNDRIVKCAAASVVLHACSVGEMSNENSQEGGYYSSSLLDGALNWLNDMFPKVNTRESCLVRSVVKSHNDAIVSVRNKSGGRQNPSIEKPRSEPYFPFAVIA